jgi:hypothetical protein
MAKCKVDWSRLRHEFVTASQPVTLTDLAAKYGLARETVSRRSIKEQWDIQRDRYVARVDEQITERKSESAANEGAQFDITCLAYAKKLLARVDKELEGHSVMIGKGDDMHTMMDAKGKPIVEHRAAKDIAAAVKMAQDVGKAAIGDKQPNLTITSLDFGRTTDSELKAALALVEKVTKP